MCCGHGGGPAVNKHAYVGRSVRITRGDYAGQTGTITAVLNGNHYSIQLASTVVVMLFATYLVFN